MQRRGRFVSLSLAVILVDVVLLVLAFGGAALALVGHENAAVDMGSDLSMDHALTSIGGAVAVGAIAFAGVLHIALAKRADPGTPTDDPVEK